MIITNKVFGDADQLECHFFPKEVSNERVPPKTATKHNFLAIALTLFSRCSLETADRRFMVVKEAMYNRRAGCCGAPAARVRGDAVDHMVYIDKMICKHAREAERMQQEKKGLAKQNKPDAVRPVRQSRVIVVVQEASKCLDSILQISG